MSIDDTRMSFIEHLGELRSRLIKAIAGFFLAVVICYIFADPIISALKKPLSPVVGNVPVQIEEEGVGLPADAVLSEELTEREEQIAWVTLTPLEYIFVTIKVAGYGGLVLAFPWLVYQFCAFVFPGLHPKEKRAIQILVWGGGIFAMAGVAVAYFVILPIVLSYLTTWVPDTITMQFRLNETMTIIIRGLVAFAIAFQFPMVVLVLVYMELLTPAQLKKWRRGAIVVMAVAAAVLTPPEPISLLILLVPLVLLYELSIVLSHLVIRRKREAAEEDAA